MDYGYEIQYRMKPSMFSLYWLFMQGNTRCRGIYCGAAGIRTRVQTKHQKVFYMLSF